MQLSSHMVDVPQPSSPPHLPTQFSAWLQPSFSHVLEDKLQNSSAAQSAFEVQPVLPLPPQWIADSPSATDADSTKIQVNNFFIFFLLVKSQI
jgi:hypothetical protein